MPLGAIRFGAMFMDLPVDAIVMHPIGLPPTEGDLLVAEAKSTREWISEVAATLESTDPDHTIIEVRAFITRIGTDLVDTYLNNLAKHTPHRLVPPHHPLQITLLHYPTNNPMNTVSQPNTKSTSQATSVATIQSIPS